MQPQSGSCTEPGRKEDIMKKRLVAWEAKLLGSRQKIKHTCRVVIGCS